MPLVTALHDGRRRVIAAVDAAAATIGLRPGMAVAQALAIVPDLHVADAEPEADAAALLRLARWCHRTTPLASVDAPDGLWLDIDGCAHLWGGEAALMKALIERLDRDGLQVRAAVADTPGAANAVARHGDDVCTIVSPGQQGAAIAPLSVACLRLPPELIATLRRLGFEQVRHLVRIPRAMLAHRFGPLPGLRLDQAYGRVQEILQPLLLEPEMEGRLAFPEPLLTAEALSIAIGRLVAPLCAEMERAGLGARQLDLLFERVDSRVVAIRIGTARPSRDAHHLGRLLNERLETVDPGMGVEAMRLVASVAEPLQWEQQDGNGGGQNIAPLVDRLANRLGADRLYRTSSLDSEMPERSVRHEPPATIMSTSITAASPVMQNTVPPVLLLVASLPAEAEQKTGETTVTTAAVHHLRLVESPLPLKPALSDPLFADPPKLDWKRPWDLRRMPPKPDRHGPAWPNRLRAPPRLLSPPRPIEAIAALPDQPPVAFTWRRHRHRICRADGPERVYGEWWRKNEEKNTVRDYFQVEDERGQRFWLFREGNGLDSRTGDLSWYLHGLF